jgi:hypothetical protein
MGKRAMDRMNIDGTEDLKVSCPQFSVEPVNEMFDPKVLEEFIESSGGFPGHAEKTLKVLVDAIRDGRAREREIAVRVKTRLGNL